MAQVHYLNPSTLRREVINAALSHPATLYPVTAGILAGAAALTFDLGVLVLGVSALPLLTGVGHAAVRWTLGREGIEKRLFARHQAAMEREQTRKLALLNEAFVRHESDEGARQLQKLNEKFDNFRELLGRKLSPDELTYSRYLNRALTVYHATLDNLTEVADRLKSISAIRIDEIETRLSSRPDLPSEQRLALEKRVQLYHGSLDAVAELYGANESALTLLDTSAAELASITTNALEEMDLKQAMQEFDECIKRLGRYSIR